MSDSERAHLRALLDEIDAAKEDATRLKFGLERDYENSWSGAFRGSEKGKSAVAAGDNKSKE